MRLSECRNKIGFYQDKADTSIYYNVFVTDDDYIKIQVYMESDNGYTPTGDDIFDFDFINNENDPEVLLIDDKN